MGELVRLVTFVCIFIFMSPLKFELIKLVCMHFSLTRFWYKVVSYHFSIRVNLSSWPKHATHLLTRPPINLNRQMIYQALTTSTKCPTRFCPGIINYRGMPELFFLYVRIIY